MVARPWPRRLEIVCAPVALGDTLWDEDKIGEDIKHADILAHLDTCRHSRGHGMLREIYYTRRADAVGGGGKEGRRLSHLLYSHEWLAVVEILVQNIIAEEGECLRGRGTARVRHLPQVLNDAVGAGWSGFHVRRRRLAIVILFVGIGGGQ